MPSFGKRSRRNLAGCHPDLIRLFEDVVKEFDCSIICGHRGEEAQNTAYNEGKSKLKYPESKHNSLPSLAVDAVPYPIDWNDTDRFYFFGGYVLGKASKMGIRVRWGGDWDRDKETNDQTFFDLPHFELVP